MKNPVESLLEDDHQSLSQLFTNLNSALNKPDIARSFELLDLFWARLAVHIRAEHLHLFPAVTNASASLFTASGLPTYEEAQTVIAHLRADHDFFMKKLALLVKTMRELVGGRLARDGEIEDLRQRLSTIAKRLEVHNRLEEDQVYAWPSLLFDEQTVVALSVRLQSELDHAPPRFASGSDSLPE